GGAQQPLPPQPSHVRRGKDEGQPSLPPEGAARAPCREQLCRLPHVKPTRGPSAGREEVPKKPPPGTWISKVQSREAQVPTGGAPGSGVLVPAPAHPHAHTPPPTLRDPQGPAKPPWRPFSLPALEPRGSGRRRMGLSQVGGGQRNRPVALASPGLRKKSWSEHSGAGNSVCRLNGSLCLNAASPKRTPTLPPWPLALLLKNLFFQKHKPHPTCWAGVPLLPETQASPHLLGGGPSSSRNTSLTPPAGQGSKPALQPETHPSSLLLTGSCLHHPPRPTLPCLFPAPEPGPSPGTPCGQLPVLACLLIGVATASLTAPSRRGRSWAPLCLRCPLGVWVMAWAHRVALLLLLLPAAVLGQAQQPQLPPGPPGLQYRYDCGVQAMQLLVFPPPGQTIRFKAMDEFGNLFEVNNCSICYHWIISEPQGPAILSAEYRGCHVLQKDGRFHLSVSIEAVLPGGRLAGTKAVTLTCAPTAHAWTPPGPPQAPLATSWSSLPTPSVRSLLPAPHHASPSPAHPEPGSVQPAAASPSLGPAPSHPTPTRHPWGTWELSEVDEPAYTGTHLSPGQCQVASGHIPCQVRSSQAACQRAGCCYDSSGVVPCYYGNTVTIQCFRSGHVVLVVSRETALAHRVSLASMHLAFAPPGCAQAQQTGDFTAFRFALTRCGTTLQVVGDQLIYENQLVSGLDVQVGPQGSITRDGTFQLLVRCIFNTSDFLPIRASVLPALLAPAPWPTAVSQTGPLLMELRIARDAAFSSYYQEGDYPVVKLLRQPVHLEVRLLQAADPRLALVLRQCWAAPSLNPFGRPQWAILSDGCPSEGDSYRTQLVPVDSAEVPVPSHYQRFTVAAFTFLDPGFQGAPRKQVYFFCSASVCFPSASETCLPSCRSPRQRRSSGARNTTAPQSIVSSPGPVSFEDSYRQEPPPRPAGVPSRNSSPRPLLWVLPLLLAVALVLGSGVFVGLRRVRARKSRDSRG
ncbi:Zona pellucida sperm-binding protein 1, partial [Galemys pyrenaicus]